MGGAGTQAGVMSTLQYVAIDPERLDAMRGLGATAQCFTFEVRPA